MDVKLDGKLQTNNSITDDPAEYVTGQNVIFNQTEVREFHFIVNGKPQSKAYAEKKLEFAGHRCIGPCITEKVRRSAIEANFRKWSEEDSWAYPTEDGSGTEKKMPKEGDKFVIE